MQKRSKTNAMFRISEYDCLAGPLHLPKLQIVPTFRSASRLGGYGGSWRIPVRNCWTRPAGGRILCFFLQKERQECVEPSQSRVNEKYGTSERIWKDAKWCKIMQALPEHPLQPMPFQTWPKRAKRQESSEKPRKPSVSRYSPRTPGRSGAAYFCIMWRVWSQIYPVNVAKLLNLCKIHNLPQSVQGTVGANKSAGQNGSGFRGRVPCASPGPVPCAPLSISSRTKHLKLPWNNLGWRWGTCESTSWNLLKYLKICLLSDLLDMPSCPVRIGIPVVRAVADARWAAGHLAPTVDPPHGYVRHKFPRNGGHDTYSLP